MPKPRDDETRNEFMNRCIPIVLDDGTAESQEQAVAVCSSMWENREKSEKAETRDSDQDESYWGWDTDDLVIINEDDGSETPMTDYLKEKYKSGG